MKDANPSVGAILVFAKEPRPGRVKTRMCPPLTPAQAAVFYEHLLADVLEATAEMAVRLGLEGRVYLDPEEAVGSFSQRVPSSFRVFAQRGDGLGERMENAVEATFTAGAERVLLRGSDSPALGERVFSQALGALEDHDVALSPDVDGGFGLVALNKPWPGLFDSPMSTSTVYADTRVRAQQLGARVCAVDPCFDVDRWEDLRLLEQARGGSGAALCPRTLAYLDETGLWPSLDSDLPPG